MTQQVFRLDDPASIRLTPARSKAQTAHSSVSKDGVDVVDAAVICASAAKRVPGAPGASNHSHDTLQSRGDFKSIQTSTIANGFCLHLCLLYVP